MPPSPNRQWFLMMLKTSSQRSRQQNQSAFHQSIPKTCWSRSRNRSNLLLSLLKLLLSNNLFASVGVRVESNARRSRTVSLLVRPRSVRGRRPRHHLIRGTTHLTDQPNLQSVEGPV